MGLVGVVFMHLFDEVVLVVVLGDEFRLFLLGAHLYIIRLVYSGVYPGLYI